MVNAVNRSNPRCPYPRCPRRARAAVPSVTCATWSRARTPRAPARPEAARARGPALCVGRTARDVDAALALCVQPGACAFLADGGLAAGGLAAGDGDGGAPPSPQHTSALAWQVCSSKTMKLRKRSHFTSFLPTVYWLMPWPLVQSAMYLSSSFLASLVGPSLP